MKVIRAGDITGFDDAEILILEDEENEEEKDENA